MAALHRRKRDTPAREGGGGRGVPVLLDGGAGSADHRRRGERGGEREGDWGKMAATKGKGKVKVRFPKNTNSETKIIDSHLRDRTQKN